jgi:hypothetical protein
MLKRIAVAVLLAAWFLGHTWPGLLRDFSEDDLMNMYFAWVLPLPRLLLGNLTPFTSVYRPLGSAFYRVMYDAAGLHPFPFRVAAYALMLLNIWLVYRLVAALTGSAKTGVLSALIFSYHKLLYGIYVNGGTIYDVLCGTFFCLTLWLYVVTRERRGNVTGWPMLGFLGLYTLALNSKEMAASIPVILLAYELIFRKGALGWKWILERHAIWIAVAMTAVSYKLKTATASSFHGVQTYDRVFTLERYLSTMTPLISQLFWLRDHALGPAAAMAILAGMFALALAMRNRVMMLGAAILVLAALPINFIEYRGFFVMYIPLIGFALYASAGLMAAAGRRVPYAAVFMMAVAALFLVDRWNHMWNFGIPDVNQLRIEAMRGDLTHFAVPKGGRVLLLRQAFDPGNYDALFVFRLRYRDPEIAVDIAKASGKYDLVLDYGDGHYFAVHEPE